MLAARQVSLTRFSKALNSLLSLVSIVELPGVGVDPGSVIGMFEGAMFLRNVHAIEDEDRFNVAFSKDRQLILDMSFE